MLSISRIYRFDNRMNIGCGTVGGIFTILCNILKIISKFNGSKRSGINFFVTGNLVYYSHS